MAGGSHWSVLEAHAGSPAAVGATLTTEVRLAARSLLVCDYVLHADLRQVRLPAGTGERRDGLWHHTCFEAFIAAPHSSVYYEFNFSPGFDWAAYRFEDYRQGMAPAQLLEPPLLSLARRDDRLEVSASVELAGLPELADAPHLRLGLAAVLEDAAGARSYWALAHPPGKPDFHHPEGFVLELHP